MYSNQTRKMQQPQPGVHSQSDFDAKAKLNGYIYEYLVHSGAKQAADAFKNEILQGTNVQISDSPGFLQNWWMVFWDLYAAAPERRDKYEHSQEAKAFHDYGLIQSSFTSNPPPPMMNGIHGGPQFQNATPSPMGMPPGPDGMMPGYFTRPMQPGPSGNSSQSSPIAGAPPRYAHPRGGAPQNFPGVPPHMFPNEQMRSMAAQRMNPAAQRMPNFPPGMRPGMPPRYGSFMESPASSSPFHNGPMSNPSHMSSPGPNGPPPDFHGMMPGNMQQFMPNNDGPTPVSTSAGMNGPSGMDGGQTQLSNLLNQEDIKNSPMNGNAGPGSQAAHPGPGSVHGPSSVASQPPSTQPQNPAQQQHDQQMDFNPGQQQGGGNDPNLASNGHDESEISRIKSSLLLDFENT